MVETGQSHSDGTPQSQSIALSSEFTPAERELLKTTNIFLVGLPGSGKSTVGPEIARITGMKFTDSDQLFKDWTGEDPNQYIKEHNMPAFRERESSVLDLAVVRKDQVLATGGGIVETPRNVGHLLREGFTVYLEAELDTLARRIMTDPNNERAGLLSGNYDEIMGILQERYNNRYRAFNAAPIHIRVDRIGPRQVASIAKSSVLRKLGFQSPAAETATS